MAGYRNDPEIHILLTSSVLTDIPQVTTVSTEPRKYPPRSPNVQVSARELSDERGPLGLFGPR